MRNFNKSNQEIVKDILSSEGEKLQKIRISLFDFILFHFLTEDFEPICVEERFENLRDLFKSLLQTEKVYPFKMKYEFTLYGERNLKNPQHKELLYGLKLSVLQYLAKTKQIKAPPSSLKVLTSYQDYKASAKLPFFLLDLATIFEHWSENKEFQEKTSVEFM